MGRISDSPTVVRKVLFLQKHASRVLVSPQGISSPNITIQFGSSVRISDSTFGIGTRDLLDMIRHTSTFQIDGGTLVYDYESTIGDRTARISRHIELFDMSHGFDVEAPLQTLKLKDLASGRGLNILSNDDTTVTYRNGKLVLETFGYVSTRMVVDADKVDGVDYFKVKVRGKDLRVASEAEGERVLCYHENCLVMYGFEREVTTAIAISLI